VQAEIIYAFDGYCGWCWGMAENILKLRENFSDRFRFSAISGGLMIGDRIGPLGDFAAYIEKAQPRVEQMTGAIFSEAHKALIRDRTTMQDSRVPAAAFGAILAAAPQTDTILLSHEILSLNFKDGADLSKPESYAPLLLKYGVDAVVFAADLKAGKLYPGVEKQFDDARETYGADAFPTIIYGREGQYFPLSQGYQNYDGLANALDVLHREPPQL
jgi:putative protein-disulfide isomerase